MNRFSNIEVMSGLIASLLGVTILLTSLTLAWPVSSDSATNDIKFGSLKVEAGLLEYQHPIMEPGEDKRNNIGWVQNLGNLPVIARLDFTVQVELSDGTVLMNPREVSVKLQENGTTYSFTGTPAKPFGLWYREDNFNYYAWFKGPDDKLYVVMDGSDRLNFAYTISTDDGAIEPEFQDAVVRVELEWKATQVWSDAAITDMLAHDFDDIIQGAYHAFLEIPFVVSPLSLAAEAKTPAERFAEKLERMPEGAFKDFFESKFADLYEDSFTGRNDRFHEE